MKKMLIILSLVILFASCASHKSIHKESTEISADSLSLNINTGLDVMKDSISLTEKTTETESNVTKSETNSTATIQENIEETESPDGTKTRVINRTIYTNTTYVDSSEYTRTLEEDIAYERHLSDSLSNVIFEMKRNSYTEESKVYNKEVSKLEWFVFFIIGFVVGGITILICLYKSYKEINGKKDQAQISIFGNQVLPTSGGSDNGVPRDNAPDGA